MSLDHTGDNVGGSKNGGGDIIERHSYGAAKRMERTGRKNDFKEMVKAISPMGELFII